MTRPPNRPEALSASMSSCTKLEGAAGVTLSDMEDPNWMLSVVGGWLGNAPGGVRPVFQPATHNLQPAIPRLSRKQVWESSLTRLTEPPEKLVPSTSVIGVAQDWP